MYKQVRVMNWLLQIDREATLTAYNQIPMEGCKCGYCRNFRAALDTLPPAFLHILHSLGVNPIKFAEVTEYCANEDGTHLYSGWYHIVGKTIDSSIDKTPVDPKLNEFGRLQLTDNFEFGITTEAHLVPENFPKPVLQIEFFGNFPWLLEEKP